MIKRLKSTTEKLLYAAECVFLFTHGWRPVKPKHPKLPWTWAPPKGYTRRFNHEHGHAINSTKQWVSINRYRRR